MDTDTKIDEKQLKTTAETLAILQARAQAARVKADQLWQSLKEAEVWKRKYEEVAAAWHTAFQQAERLEGAAKILEETR